MKMNCFMRMLAIVLVAMLLMPTALAEDLAVEGEVYEFGEEYGSSEVERLMDDDDETTNEVDQLTTPERNGDAAAEETVMPNGSVAINATNFPDALFRELIRNNYDENGNGVLSDSEIARVEEISVVFYYDDGSEYIVKSLKGIEHFYNLTSLSCVNVRLNSLDLSKNRKLEYFTWEGCGLKHLDLSRNPSLQSLFIYDDKDMISVDISNCSFLLSWISKCKFVEGYESVWWEDEDEESAIDISKSISLTAGGKVLYQPANSVIVTLAASNVTLAVKDTFALSPQVTPANKGGSVRFKSSNAKVAKVDAKTGKITAKKKGTATISATLDGKVMASCKVTVKKAPSKVSLNKSKVTVEAGATYQLTAKIPSGTYTSKYTWTSSNSNVATVSASGLVTGVSKGTAKITVKTGNGKKATCKVTVKAAKKLAKRVELADYLGAEPSKFKKDLGLSVKEIEGDCYYDSDISSSGGYTDGYFKLGYIDYILVSADKKGRYAIGGCIIGMTETEAQKTLTGNGYQYENTYQYQNEKTVDYKRQLPGTYSTVFGEETVWYTVWHKIRLTFTKGKITEMYISRKWKDL